MLSAALAVAFHAAFHAAATPARARTESRAPRGPSRASADPLGRLALPAHGAASLVLCRLQIASPPLLHSAPFRIPPPSMSLLRTTSSTAASKRARPDAAAAAAPPAPLITAYRPLSAQSASGSKPRTPSLAKRLLQRSPSWSSPNSSASLSPSPPPVAARTHSLLARQTSGSAANGTSSFLSRPPTGMHSNGGSPSAAAASSSSAAAAASPPSRTRPGSASSRTASPHLVAFHVGEVSADPFACEEDEPDPFGAATQPLDDEPSPRAHAPSAARALSSSLSRSASVSSSAGAGAGAGAASPTLSRAASYSGASASASAIPAARSTLSGAQREAMDDLEFLLDGMRSAMASVRSDSSLKLMHKMLGLELEDAEDGLASPAALSRSASLTRKPSRSNGNEVSPLMLMRACDGFKTLTALMPSTEELLAAVQNTSAAESAAEHARLATLLTGVALAASQDGEKLNAAHFSGRAAEILFALAMASPSSVAANSCQSPAAASATPTPASQSCASGSQSQGDQSPSAAASNGGWGALRQKRRQASNKPLATANDLAQLFQRQQTALIESQRSTEMDLTGSLVERQEQSRLMHLVALPCLSYCALLALTSMAEDDTFVDHLLHSSGSATELVLQQLAGEIQECRHKLKQIAVQEPAPQPKPTRGKKAASAVAPAPSYERQLLQHRLACCLSILECCMNHGASYIGIFSKLQLPSASDAEPQPASQLLFNTMLDFLPCLEQRQQQALVSKVSSDVPPSQLMLPVDDPAPVAPLLSLLRLLCNATNRNEAGIAVLTREYRLEGHDKVSLVQLSGTDCLVSCLVFLTSCLCCCVFYVQPTTGLAVVFRALSSVHWSLLSHTLGHHDIFNLATFALPVLVNCVEESAESRRIIDQQCSQLGTRNTRRLPRCLLSIVAHPISLCCGFSQLVCFCRRTLRSSPPLSPLCRL